MKTLISSLAFLFTSCIAYHHGTLSESNPPSDGKRTVDFAHGYARVNRILFFGGRQTDALVAEAKQNLFLSYPLRDDQYFANYVVDFQESFHWLVLHTTQVVVTAEVIGPTPVSSPFMEEVKESTTLEREGFQIGEAVTFETSYGYQTEARILGFPASGVTIGYITPEGRYQVRNISLKKIAKAESKSIEK